MENINADLLLKRLRNRLNVEKIKLWLPPFTTERKEKGEVPQDLVRRYAEEMKVSFDDVAHGLEELRLHALAKLEEREKFQNSGIATLRVRLSGAVSSERMVRKPEALECSLDITGQDLMELIAAKYSVQASRLKLISGGKIIHKRTSLISQNVKSGSDVMAMVLSSSETNISEKEAEMAELDNTKWAAKMLSSRADDDEDFDIQIADQKGKPLLLPPQEKKALTVAMTLHEKGRVALKNKKVSLALTLFIEADNEFSLCSANILDSVDNYGILCLDIVWCYLMLKNLEQLPDAESRLNVCESCFKRCYGEKMERLVALKGGSGMEQSLFMRLYLLQGVVAFHKGDLINAHNYFRRAEFVLTLLHVDDNHLHEKREARLALRAKNGNVQQAVEYIVEKKREEEEVNKKAKREWKLRVKRKKLGMTACGEPVNIDYFHTLVGMDFPSGAAAEALRQANNDINQAIEILSTNPDLLNLPDVEKSHKEISDALIDQLCSLGFSAEVARMSLKRFKGDVQKALDELIKNNGTLPTSSSSAASMSSSSVSPAYSSDSDASEATSTGHLNHRDKEQLKSLVSDINADTDDHLDLALTEEREILSLYLGLVRSIA